MTLFPDRAWDLSSACLHLANLDLDKLQTRLCLSVSTNGRSSVQRLLSLGSVLTLPDDPGSDVRVLPTTEQSSGLLLR
ncbi:hypothetical protein A0H81_05088 [Grifola frondosa]|uniref:Uncharacterized protein n=1 Tax=Grifola frondosa TaxID=5627 RepID=A0A1C7MEZ7_GRIFR|nr:hypothetical protein A0H81_05088 [Grifola frondosa]